MRIFRICSGQLVTSLSGMVMLDFLFTFICSLGDDTGNTCYISQFSKSNPQMYSGLFHYSAEIVPIIIFALIESLVLIVWLMHCCIAILAP